jgi:hypothetical protein
MFTPTTRAVVASALVAVVTARFRAVFSCRRRGDGGRNGLTAAPLKPRGALARAKTRLAAFDARTTIEARLVNAWMRGR